MAIRFSEECDLMGAKITERQAELKNRSSPPSDVRRGCRDIRTAIQR